MALPEPRGAGLSVAFARLAAVLVCVIGEIVLAMWLHIIPGLDDALPSLAGMTPNAALGIIAAGLGLLCFTFRRLRVLARVIGFVLVAAGLLVFAPRRSRLVPTLADNPSTRLSASPGHSSCSASR